MYDEARSASHLGACLEIGGLTLGTAFTKATSDKQEEAVGEVVTFLKGTPH